MCVDKKAFYLRVMLAVLLGDYKVEVNSIADRETLKTLIAIVFSKRDGGTNTPGNKLIRKVREMVERKLVDGDKPEELN